MPVEVIPYKTEIPVINYKTQGDFDTLQYPPSDTYSILGPLYLPKVYGKGLSTFELASSGTIAVTLRDVYAFDLEMPENTNTVKFNTRDNKELNLASGPSNLSYIDLKSATEEVKIYGRSNITLETAQDVEVQAGQTQFFYAASSNATNIYLDGTNADVYVKADSNIYLNAGEKLAVTAKQFTFNGDEVGLSGSNGELRIGNSNAWIRIYDSNIEYVANKDMNFTTSNNTTYDNLHDFTLTSSNLKINLFNDLVIAASNDVKFTASNDWRADVVGKAQFEVGGEMLLGAIGKIKATTSNAFEMNATNGINLRTPSNLDVVADKLAFIKGKEKAEIASDAWTFIGAPKIEAKATNETYFTIDGTLSNVTLAAQKKFLADAEETVQLAGATTGSTYLKLDGPAKESTLYGASNVLLTATQLIGASADQFSFKDNDTIHISASNKTIDLKASEKAWIRIHDSNISYMAQNDMNFTVSNVATFDALKSFSLTTSNVTVTAKEDAKIDATGKLDLIAAKDASIVTSQKLIVSASNDTIDVYTPMFDLEATTFQSKGTTIDLFANNDFKAVSANTASITASNTLIMQGKDKAYVKINDDNVISAESGIIKTRVSGRDTLVVDGDSVTVYGQLKVNGDINSITTYQDTLHIIDKEILLSAGENNQPFVDGTLNSGSGLFIAGLPSLTETGEAVPNTEANQKLYEKSIKLVVPRNDSMMWLKKPAGEATSEECFDNESFWDVRGGDLRLSLQKDDNKQISFGFRIGARDELELIKKYWSTTEGDYVTKVISRFGRSVSNNQVYIS